MLRILAIVMLVLCAAGFSCAQVKQPGGFFAQRFTVAAGAAFSLPEEKVPASAGLLFAPRIFITTAYSDFSISLDPSPEALYSFSDSQSFSEKLFFQLPVMIHLNLGHLASKDFHSTYGFFIGGGWNFQFADGESTTGFDHGYRNPFLVDRAIIFPRISTTFCTRKNIFFRKFSRSAN